MKTVKAIAGAIILLGLIACGNGSTTYSLLAEQQIFRQDAGSHNSKIDILFVIDNSGSMQSSQTKLGQQFPIFINKFVSKGFDFKLAVTTSDSYLSLPVWTPNYNAWKSTYFEDRPQLEKAWFRDGTKNNRNGIPVILPSTPDIPATFIENAVQGTQGRGDERSLQAFRTALESGGNANFRRAGSFLAVVILTDEDDFSHSGTAMYERYDAPLHPVSDYVTFLENFTGTSGAEKKFSVSTIAVPCDSASATPCSATNDLITKNCITQLGNGGQKGGKRVGEIADLTGGIRGSICGDFATELDKISAKIVSLATQFYLKGDPIPESIKVYVNGNLWPNEATNPVGDGGWTYNAAANSIMFVGAQAYVPPQGSMIQVTFDPKTIQF